ncbi:MAG TPA: MmcQ/YjbR family DNA-binding protein [Acidimicrobiales bacterium]|jgi:hypothetical protein
MAGPRPPIERIRLICLSLPEAVEQPFGGHTSPAFRVRDKLFVMTSEDATSMTMKGDRGVQQALVAQDPARYFVPKYVGPKGWVGVMLTKPSSIDWGEVTELIVESYCLIAPKKLGSQAMEEFRTPE